MPILILSSLMSIAVYFITYVPYMLKGHDFLEVYKLQWEMLSYHSNLRAIHPFSSPWWSWPLISRPLWLTVYELPDANTSTIASLGNPLIWWVGLVYVILTVERAVINRDDTSIFIAATSLFQWVPFSLLRRVLFIYHFYINVPILILAITLHLHDSWRNKEKRKMGVIYLIATCLAFALFFPVISGVPIQNRYRLLLRWLPRWLF
jgi:dolichyl-phosphate-mannose--protein O-mannosyl transferase